MKKLFVLVFVVISLLMVSGCGGGSGSTATGEIDGSVVVIPNDLTNPILASDAFITTERVLETIGMSGIMGKEYRFIIRGDFNNWDCNNQWDRMQPSDVFAERYDGILCISGRDLLEQARKHSITTPMRDGGACIIAFDSAGNMVAQTRKGLKLYDLIRAFLPEAKVSVVGTNIFVNTDDDGNFKLTGVPVGIQTLEISCNGCKTTKATFSVKANSPTIVEPIEVYDI